MPLRFETYTYRGEPIEDIEKWCADRNEKLLKVFWKEYDPLQGVYIYYETLSPESFHDNMRFSKGQIIKTEEYSQPPQA